MAPQKNIDTPAPSLIRRAGRLTVRLAITAAVVAAAGFAVQMGASELANRAEAAPAPEAAAKLSVTAVPVSRDTGFDIKRSYPGQVEAQRSVSLSFEFAGRLATMMVDEGDTVATGTILARQDTQLLEAEQSRHAASKAALAAQLTLAEQTLERAERLNTSGISTQADLDRAIATRDELIARLAEVDAALATIAIQIDKAQIAAPFAGRITLRAVDGGESLAPGQTVVGIVEEGAPQVRVGVPLDLDPEALQTAEIRIGDAILPASLLSIRPDIDPVTRTRTAIFQLDEASTAPYGQTASLMVTQRIDQDGMWVPTTSLKEGLRGQWTLLALDENQIVRSATAEILHAESDRVYVRAALPDGTLLIEEGPQRITTGQQVVLQASN